jgi:hypothetical protein
MADVITQCRDSGNADHLAIEMVACYGMPVGQETFETVLWIGRFVQVWTPKPWTRVYRRDVKLHLCHSARAKDAHVRMALLDKFGPGRQKAIGTRKHPGPLYGIKSHVWSALAVAVTWWESPECGSVRQGQSEQASQDPPGQSSLGERLTQRLEKFANTLEQGELTLPAIPDSLTGPR